MNNLEQIQNMLNEPITLSQLYDSLERHFYLEDKMLTDLILAVMISREQKEAKLWLIIIGPSGDGKTELIKLFENEEKAEIK